MNNFGMFIDFDREKILKPGTVVSHFKKYLIDLSDSNNLSYLYMVLCVGKHTETGEDMVVYKALYDGKIYCRPKEMFLSKVDHSKYPDCKEKYRFTEVVL